MKPDLQKEERTLGVFTLSVENDEKETRSAAASQAEDKKMNYWETFMHISKSNLGAGIFSMGNAFKNSGILLGSVLAIILGFVCVYCQHLMLNVCDETARRLKMEEPLGFEETASLCFKHGHPKARRWAPHMGRAVNIFVCITQSGFCCVYIVFISSNVKQVWDYYLPNTEAPLSAVMAIVIIPMILLSWVQDLKALAPFSVVANILVTAGIITVLVVAVQGLPSISERKLVDVTSMPLFFGTVVYTFEGIGLVTPIKKKSRNPEQFGTLFGPLNVAMTVLLIIILLLGVLGYWRWGDGVEDSLTLNLDQSSILAQCVKILISLGVLLTYPLQLSPAITNTMNAIRKRYGPFVHPLLVDISYRTLYTLMLFFFAEVVPHLALFISLVGAVSSTAIALIIPPLMDLVTFYEDYGRFYWRIWKNLLIVFLGVLGFISGSYFSLSDIIYTFQ